MLKHANKSTLYDNIMEQMITAIKKNLWKPGGRIPGEKALAETFGVSRASMREVLKALAHSGVLEARPGQGTFLSQDAVKILNGNEIVAAMFSKYTYSEIMEIRRLLEGQAAYWAAERATPESIQRLETILKGDADGEPISSVHAKFHAALVEMAGNRLLVRLHHSIRDVVMTQRAFHFSVLPDEDLRQHWDVLEAIKSGSPEAARKVMLKHVDLYWKKLGSELGPNRK